MAVNATPLSEPSGVYLGSHSGSSAFWQPAVEPGASMWVNGALGVSVLISPLFFLAPLSLICFDCDVCVHRSEDDVFSSWCSVAVWLSVWAALEPVSTCRWAEAVALLRSWVDLVRLFTRVFSSVSRFWTVLNVALALWICGVLNVTISGHHHWSMWGGERGLSMSWSQVRVSQQIRIPGAGRWAAVSGLTFVWSACGS